MTTIDTSREAVEALMEGVTEGPWIAGPRSGASAFANRWEVRGPDYGMIATMSFPDEGDDTANARFIAASRELVPALLDRAEKAEAELATLKAERERLREAASKLWEARHDPNLRCTAGPFLGALGDLGRALGDA